MARIRIKDAGVVVHSETETFDREQAARLWMKNREAELAKARPSRTWTGRIFPYNSDTISRVFTDACTLLGIEDLHFHDLRHDGISRLFELGWNIPNVAAVSDHRTWNSLRRHTHLRQRGDKYEGWAWLPKLGIDLTP